MASIFNDALPKHQKNNDLDTLITEPPRVNNKNVTKNNYGEPRVAQNEPEQITESSAPTNPSQLTKQKQIHLRKTRNNTPIPNPPQSAPNNTSQRQSLRTPRYVSQAALQQLCSNACACLEPFTPKQLRQQHTPITVKHTCNGVVHPVSGQVITKYKTLINDNLLQDIWEEAMCIELGRLSQGYKDTQYTNTIRFMDHKMINDIPKNQTVTYGHIVVDYFPQKDDPNRVRITAGGNLIDYPDELTTRTADLRTTKLLWNSMLSTKDARYMCIDIENMYLATLLDRYEYMRMPVGLIPERFTKLYNLHEKIKN